MRLIISITLFFSILIVQSQNKVTPIQIGNEYVISSKILDQDRVIQIYTPPAYHEFSNKSFPVLYVLDSQEYFLYGIAYQDMLRFKDKAPPFIVVGIKTDRRLRRTLFYKESEKFSSFLKDELIPYIDTNYRTKKQKERLYFGWEMAAGLGLEILAEFPELFSGYILASPTHATNTRMKALRESNNKELNRLLYVSSADEETWIHKDSAFLAHIKLFKSSHFSLFKDEDHYSTPSKSIDEGLSIYFNDYAPVLLRTQDALEEYGGIEKLETYYKNRGERYNLPTEIHRETQHFLILSAEKEDNLELFIEYLELFDNYIPTITRDFWINRYAQFYLKNNKINEAIELLNIGLEKFPDSILLYKGLAESYSKNGEKSEAKKANKRALELEAKNN